MNISEDPSWAYYPETILELDGAVAVSFPVRIGPTRAQLEDLSDLGLPSVWAVITPCNPRGRPVTAAENQERLCHAAAELSSMGAQYWKAVGRATDGQHAEEGFAIAMDRAAARRLAIVWEQSAFFWIDGREVSLCGALIEQPDVRLTPEV